MGAAISVLAAPSIASASVASEFADNCAAWLNSTCGWVQLEGDPLTSDFVFINNAGNEVARMSPAEWSSYVDRLVSAGDTLGGVPAAGVAESDAAAGARLINQALAAPAETVAEGSARASLLDYAASVGEWLSWDTLASRVLPALAALDVGWHVGSWIADITGLSDETDPFEGAPNSGGSATSCVPKAAHTPITLPTPNSAGPQTKNTPAPGCVVNYSNVGQIVRRVDPEDETNSCGLSYSGTPTDAKRIEVFREVPPWCGGAAQVTSFDWVPLQVDGIQPAADAGNMPTSQPSLPDRRAVAQTALLGATGAPLAIWLSQNDGVNDGAAELDGSPGNDDNRILVPAWSTREDVDDYANDLATAGFTNVQLKVLGENAIDPAVGPHEVSMSKPKPGELALPGDPVVVRYNPDDAPEPDAQPSGSSFCDGAGDVRPFDLGPLTAIDMGSKFPFGVPAWLLSFFSTWVSSATAPSWTFKLGSNIDWHVSLASLDGTMNIIRPVIAIVSALGFMWMLASSFLNIDRGEEA